MSYLPNFSKLKLFNNIYGYVILTVIFPVALLKILGILQPFEFAVYDFLFWVKPLETIEQRIVLVEWDEQSIITLSESSISDQTLVSVLDKILVQEPRVIGLDLYRNLPVPSPNADDQSNTQAYKSLQAIFATNSEIIGIQKNIIPFVDPPATLKKQNRVAASDLPSDRDFRIRRGYLFPTVDRQEQPTQIAYIGVALGYRYLAQEGWKSNNAPNGLILSKNEHQIVLNQIQSNFSNFLHHDPGWDFLINWRKTHNNLNFIRISVAELLNEPVPPNLFRERLVIIGNSASSRGDVHQTPLDRWQKWQWTNGVDIVAQVSSSIISAALNNRNLISPAPAWLEFLLLALPTICLTKLSNDSFDNNISLAKHKLITGKYIVLFGSCIAIISFITFNTGIWLSPIPGLSSIGLSYLVIYSYIQRKKRQRDFYTLEMLLRDSNHNLNSASRHINQSTRYITQYINEIAQQLKQDLEIIGEAESDVYETEIGENLVEISLRTNNINNEIARVNRYKARIDNFLKYAYSNKVSAIVEANFNQIVRQTAQRVVSERSYPYQVQLIEQYDLTIGNQQIYLEDLQIIIECLLDNALFAVNPQFSTTENYNPEIKLSTINSRQSIKIIIEDNGCGIPKRYHQQIFLPSVSFKDDGQGEGIGLYLASQIVRFWKGSISLESEVDRGSQFTINLKKISSSRR